MLLGILGTFSTCLKSQGMVSNLPGYRHSDKYPGPKTGNGGSFNSPCGNWSPGVEAPSPDHVPESAAAVFVQPQGQQPLVLALDLDTGCPKGVCRCLHQRNSLCKCPLPSAAGPANTAHLGIWCVSSLHPQGSLLFSCW